MSNIAEGFGRRSDRDFAHYLDTARGSAIEVQSLLYVALDAGYIQRLSFKESTSRQMRVISLVAGFAGYLKMK
jgi:four helix bundle protein